MDSDSKQVLVRSKRGPFFTGAILLAIGFPVIFSSSCDGGTTDPGGGPTVVSVGLTPSAPTLATLGETVLLDAVARDAQGNAIAGKTFTWSSSDDNVATVDASGLVTATGNGSATITATTDGIPGTASVTVAQVTSTVQVTPAASTLTSLGETVQLSASALDTGGAPITGKTFTWSSSDENVATVDASGLVTATGNGSATITATTDGIPGTASVTVSQVASTVEVTPAASTLTSLGETVQLSASALDAGGAPITGQAFTWSSLDENVATVDASGLVSAVGNGSATITATTDGVHGSATVTVAQVASTVEVTPAASTLTSLGETVTLAAVARDAQGDAIAGKTFTWSSSDENLATVDASGLVSAVGNGSATITATTDGIPGTASVTVAQVTSTVVVTPAASTLTSLGETVQLSASAMDAGGAPIAGKTFTWSSSDENVATVNASGLVTSVGNGVATITAAAGSVSDASIVTVAVPAPNPLVYRINAGYSHTCAVNGNGVGYCWGANGSGELGDGTTTGRLVPTSVQGGLTLRSISTGHGHSCSVTATGQGYCWGRAETGQVGDGGLGQRLAPTAVSGGLVFSSIDAGRVHTCGITTGGVVFCWGWGSNGELGNGTTENRVVPTQISGTGTYTTVRGWAHTHCAVSTSGETFCWGRNNTGQVGDGTTTCTNLQASCLGDRAEPTSVATGAVFFTVSSGARIVNGWGGGTSCGLTASGGAYCWGQSNYGQIGDGSQTSRLTPVAVSGGHSWSMIDVGSATTCGVASDGRGYCWGYNGNGMAGDGTTINRLVPTEVSGGLRFTQISVGFDHACGMTTDGKAYCWGSNPDGRLGNGTTTSSSVPVLVSVPGGM